jgi:hypothetical protein
LIARLANIGANADTEDMMSDSNVELLTMELSELLTAPVANVADVELAKRVKTAKGLFEQLGTGLDGWVEQVRVECLRQDDARQETLSEAGLVGLASKTAAAGGKKRGRKSAAEKQAEELANAENEEVARQEESQRGGALLDAE